MRIRRWPAAASAACLMMNACSSIKSRIYDTDNVTSDQRQIKCLKGIPETMDVPTHVVIRIYETKYWKGPGNEVVKPALASKEVARMVPSSDGVIAASFLVDGKPVDAEELNKKIADAEKQLEKLQKEAKKLSDEIANSKSWAGLPDAIAKNTEAIAALTKALEILKAQKQSEGANALFSLSPVRPTRSMDYNFVNKKELFTVDFKRPFSGSAKTSLKYGELSGGQYLSSVGQSSVDTTIVDVANLVKVAASTAAQLKAVSKETKAEADQAVMNMTQLGLFGVTTTIAVEYFDIHQPNIEGRIQDFLERHINRCSEGFLCEAGADPSCPSPIPTAPTTPVAPMPSPAPNTTPDKLPGTVNTAPVQPKLPPPLTTKIGTAPIILPAPPSATTVLPPKSFLPVPTAPRN